MSESKSRQDSRRHNGVVFSVPAMRVIGKAEKPWNSCAEISGIRSMRLPAVVAWTVNRPATSFRAFLPTCLSAAT